MITFICDELVVLVCNQKLRILKDFIIFHCKHDIILVFAHIAVWQKIKSGKEGERWKPELEVN